MAYTAATFADEYFKGKLTFQKKMPVAVEMVTKQNIKDYTAYCKKDQ